MQSLFNFNEYKHYIRAQIKENAKLRGYRKDLSNAASCQQSYLSRVLHEHVHLTPDHALGLCEFWSLNAEETDYFLLLLQLARAGRPSLKKLLKEKLKSLIDKQKDLSHRYKRPKLEVNEWASMYYSSWMFSAIHVCTALPDCQTPAKISRKLHIDTQLVNTILEQLKTMGLVNKTTSGWAISRSEIHIPRHSPLVSIHHQNWRLKAVENSHLKNEDDIHFTGVYALSQSDRQMIKNNILKTIDDIQSRIPSSKEETIAYLSLDFYGP